MREHPLAEELVGDTLDGDIDFGDFGVIKGLSAVGIGSVRSLSLKEYENSLYAKGGHVPVDIPKGITLVPAQFPVALYIVL